MATTKTSVIDHLPIALMKPIERFRQRGNLRCKIATEAIVFTNGVTTLIAAINSAMKKLPLFASEPMVVMMLFTSCCKTTVPSTGTSA